jgi:hypothetical protein
MMGACLGALLRREESDEAEAGAVMLAEGLHHLHVMQDDLRAFLKALR